MNKFITPGTKQFCKAIAFFAFLSAFIPTGNVIEAQTCGIDNANCYINGSKIIHVRTNDTWPSNYLTIGYSYVPFSTPAHGTITILNNDSIQYTPNTNYVGPDKFIYGVASPGNPTSASDTASVFINVVSNPNCFAVATMGPTAYACGDSIFVAGTVSNMSGPLQWNWNYGNGFTSNVPFNAPKIFVTAGSYTLTLVVTDLSNGCSAGQQIPYTVTNGVRVDAGNTVFGCQATQLNAMPVIPTSGPGLSYSWTPANSNISNPNIQNPYVDHVNNTMYTVTMYDSNTGCSAKDSLLVTVYSVNLSTYTICNGSTAILDFGPGATNYYWQNWQDTSGVNHPISANTQTYPVTQPGQYMGFAMFPGCGALTSSINVVNNCATCSLAVVANSDINYCGNVPAQASLIATAINYNSNCTVSWSPTAYLTNANSFVATLDFTQVNQHAGPVDIDYVITVTDTITGCTDSDTIHVFAASPFNETFNVCGNQPALLTGHFNDVSVYSWTPGYSSGAVLTATYPANYYLAETFLNGCTLTSVYHVVDTCTNTGCGFAVSAGSNINNCAVSPGTIAQLNAVVTPAGTYTYQWFPSTGLSNPNISNPTADNVVNQTYVVYVSNGTCTVTDTVVVTNVHYVTGNLYNCNGSPVTLTMPLGAYYYQWLFSPAPSQTTNTAIITTPGNYTYAAFYNGCAVTNGITLIDSCAASPGNVWPGDCNYDLVANCYDLLNICMAYGQTGAVRPSASLSWTAQPMADWATAAFGANDKHSDCDGNGIVDTGDVQAIIANYNFTHPYKLMAPDFTYNTSADLYLVADRHTAGLQETVTFDVMLGQSATPVNNIYALAYQLSYEDNLELVTTPVSYISSWYGDTTTNLISMEKQMAGQKDCAVGGNDHNNRTGFGKIGEFKIVTTDNLSGMAVMHANIINVVAIMNDGTQKVMSVSGDTVLINSATGMTDINANVQVGVYPNPSEGSFTVTTLGANAEAVSVYSLIGELVYNSEKVSAAGKLDLSQLAEGVYTMRIKTDKGTVSKKIAIRR
ncbi:MAG: T9SS type A sorting domain-containing protein [Bacteroidia bacterium]